MMPAPANKKKKKRNPKKISETYLHNAGLYYLGRYSASSKHFRRIMMRKVDKSCRHHTDQDRDKCAQMVDELVKKFEDAGLLDDQVYANAKTLSYRRKGYGEKAIIAKLRAKGLASPHIKKALQKINDDFDYNDYKAAARYVKRRRLGSFRTTKRDTDDEEQRKKQLQRELGALARAGFSFEISRKVLDADESELRRILSE